MNDASSTNAPNETDDPIPSGEVRDQGERVPGTLMQQDLRNLRLRPRWLALCAALVAVIVGLSVVSGVALGSSTSATARPGTFGNGTRQRQASDFPTPIVGAGAPGAQRNSIDLGVVAATLSISIAQLQAELSNGATFSQVIAAHGSTVDQVVSALVAATKVQLDQQVAAGQLTSSDEQARLAASERRFRAALTSDTVSP